MTFEDDETIDIPAEMYEGDEAVLAPVFVGHHMEAELVRSLLDANGIPAVVFGMGGAVFGAEEVGPNDRVMVRSDHVDAALAAIQSAELTEGEMIEPTADDLEVMVDEDFPEEDYPDQEIDETGYPDVEVLAGGSDWGPRLVGILGLLALAVTIVILLRGGG